ncbi:hypothetical protein CHLNCDRAFT_141521 [Chlorella variabilis]|uniref:Uncharacterized protein n=1 Tax=Chlorella variabilis TaxID=554065 RepID=E1ZT15_CHLVA|nr:hypothetical protein CHLNCDRAFT_141521 [Chlorella variabilis]EFN51036.1 hypothetical protein CHLNCDRAFT_141521 [Chlorella variabilis]|eukprot:XP_005843138.1 hypothetical protein CHLNCDRAFT_141521 [Chlorella variabilis]
MSATVLALTALIGVMVSAGFCHLLGEALKQMPRMTFPLAPFLCGTGYLFTLVADKIAASAHGGAHHGCCGGAHQHGMPAKGPAVDSCCAVEVLAGMDIAERGSGRLDKHSGEQEVQGLLERTPPRNGGLGRQHSGGGGGGGGGGSRLSHSPGGGHSTADHAVVAVNGSGSFADGRFGEQEKEGGGGGGGSGFARVSVDGFAAGPGGGAAGGRRRQGLQRDSSESLVFEVEPPSSPLLTPGSASRRSVSFLTAMLMGVALCFHSLLEGAAMGAQTTISNSLHIFIAIVSHKGLAAYALGSSIVDSDASMQRFWSVVLPFTFASPVGIFIGYVISDVAKGVGAASISALASGTFLYVAFMEVIPKELRDGSRMALKLAALLVGFGLMSLLAVWA